MLTRWAHALNPGRSLAAKLTLAIITISLVLSLLISLLIGRVAEQQAKQDIGALHAEYAQQLADELDADLYTYQQDVKIFASLFRNAPNSPNNAGIQRGLLKQIQTAYPEYGWLGLADANGKLLATTSILVTTTNTTNPSGLLEGGDVSRLTWFAYAKTQPYIGDLHEAAPLAAALSPASDGEPLRFLDVAAPVKDAAGNVIGVLGGYLSWSWVREIQHKILAPLQLRRPIEPLILASDKRVLLGPAGLLDQPLNFGALTASVAHLISQTAPTDGYQILRWADGDDYLVGFARGDGQADFKGLGWTILVREPTATAFADADQLQMRLLLFGAGLGLIFAGLGAWLMRRFTQPLNQIAAAADQIQEIEFVDIPVFCGNDEVARVSRSLHGLVNTLEARVKARTLDVVRLSEENKQVAVARERLRIARDLHDTLAHTLAGLLTEIRLLRKMAQAYPQAVGLQQELSIAEEAAREGLSEARAAIVGLRNNPVREIGLEAALRHAAHYFEAHTGLVTVFEVKGALPLLQDAHAETLYRIAEEVLRNIERHASASRVTLGLSAAQRHEAVQTTLWICDDGIGFDVNQTLEGHYGLRGMREQADVIGAAFAVESQPGQGTRIQVTLH